MTAPRLSPVAVAGVAILGAVAAQCAVPTDAAGFHVQVPRLATVFDLCEITVSSMPAELARLDESQAHDAYDADRDGRYVRLEAVVHPVDDPADVRRVPGFAMRSSPGTQLQWRIRWSPWRPGRYRVRVELEGRSRAGGTHVRLARDIDASTLARAVAGIDGPLVSPGPGHPRRHLRELLPDGTSRAQWLFGACRAWVVNSQDAHNDWAPHEWLDREAELFAPMRAAGYNLLNQWMAPWEYLLVHRDRAEFWRGADETWTRIPLPAGATWSPYQWFDQGRAAAFDRLVRRCEGDERADTIRMLLSPMPHQCFQLRSHAWGRQESGWSVEDDAGKQSAERLNGFSGFSRDMDLWGFFEADPNARLDGPRARLFDHQANFWRYVVARWSYSRAIGVWVIIDELDAIGDEVGVMAHETGWWAHPECDRWLANIVRMLRGELNRSDGMAYLGDPYRHPIHAATTSTGLQAARGGNLDWQGPTPDDTRGNPDLFGWHWYPYWDGDAEWSDVWLYAVEGVLSYSSAPVGPHPRLISEFGAPDRYDPGDAPSRLYPNLYHFSIWAAALSGHAGTPMDWDDGKEFGELKSRERAGIFSTGNYPIDNAAQLSALASFLGDVDPDEYVPCGSDDETVSIKGLDGALVCALRSRSEPHRVVGWAFSSGGAGRVVLGGLSERHTVRWVDPWTGATVTDVPPGAWVPEAGGFLTLELGIVLRHLKSRAKPFPLAAREDRGHDVAFVIEQR